MFNQGIFFLPGITKESQDSGNSRNKKNTKNKYDIRQYSWPLTYALNSLSSVIIVGMDTIIHTFLLLKKIKHRKL